MSRSIDGLDDTRGHRSSRSPERDAVAAILKRPVWVALCLLFAAGAASAQGRFAGIGRAATPAEIKAWDIDVRADLTGLPKGSGSVKKGVAGWEEKCASCHGAFGESNEAF